MRISVSRWTATGLVAVGLTEPPAVLPWAVRLVEPAVAGVLEEMLGEPVEPAHPESWRMTAVLDVLVEQAEMVVQSRHRGDLYD